MVTEVKTNSNSECVFRVLVNHSKIPLEIIHQCFRKADSVLLKLSMRKSVLTVEQLLRMKMMSF